MRECSSLNDLSEPTKAGFAQQAHLRSYLAWGATIKMAVATIRMGLAGSACERVPVVTASALSLPALMYSIDAIG